MKLLGHCCSRWDGTLWEYRGFGVPQAPVNNPSLMLYIKKIPQNRGFQGGALVKFCFALLLVPV